MFFKKFNEIEYVADLARIRYTIANMLKNYGFVDEVIIDNENGFLNPYYGKITATGAFVVEFQNGVPAYLLTPYGEIRIDSAVHYSKTIKNNKKFYHRLKKQFGLVEIEPSSRVQLEEFGPKFLITKLPWKEDVKIPTKYRSDKTVQNGAEAAAVLRYFDEISKNANELLAQNGETNFVINLPERQHNFVLQTPQKKRQFLFSTFGFKRKKVKTQNKSQIETRNIIESSDSTQDLI